MKSSRLQALLARNRLTKFGDIFTNNKWGDLLNQLLNQTVQFNDIIEPLKNSSKTMDFI